MHNEQTERAVNISSAVVPELVQPGWTHSCCFSSPKCGSSFDSLTLPAVSSAHRASVSIINHPGRIQISAQRTTSQSSHAGESQEPKRHCRNRSQRMKIKNIYLRTREKYSSLSQSPKNTVVVCLFD